MSWRDLLQAENERVVLPWLGGRSLRSRTRTWTIEGRLPPEFGLYSFKINGRTARVEAESAEARDALFPSLIRGFLVGDRLILDDVRVDPDPKKIVALSEPVFLLDPGLDRFVRITAGRIFEDGPLIFNGPDMPQGTEEPVLTAFLDEKETVDDIPGVPPALDAAFRMEVWQRAETKRRREEAEAARRAEEARRALEERRAALVEQLGDARGRREMAVHDFEAGAKAALAVGGATYLDHRASPRKHEMVVRFRFLNRRFECTCDARTLRIIDSGICLIDHDTGEKGDTRFTLESLPPVIAEAERGHKLVVFRHA
jgi:hypothetical protein